jgi:hypothetical protein
MAARKKDPVRVAAGKKSWLTRRRNEAVARALSRAFDLEQGEVDIYIPMRQRQEEGTKRFLTELEGKTQKAAVVGAEMGAAAIRSAMQSEFNTRTGSMLRSVRVIGAGDTSAAISVGFGAPHAVLLNEGKGKRNYPIPRVPREGGYGYPARYQWSGGYSPKGYVTHPGHIGAYNGYVQGAIREHEEEIGEVIFQELRV